MQEERQPMGSESLGTLLRSWRDGTFSEIWDDWKWIWGYTKRYRRAVWIYTILGVASSTLGLVSAVASKYSIDIITGYDSDRLWFVITVMVASALVGLLLRSVTSRISTKISLRVNNDIQAEVFDRLLGADWKSLNDFASGDLLSRLSTDAGAVSSSAIRWLPDLVVTVYTFIATLAVILHYDWIMALIALASAPFLLLLSRIVLKKQREYSRKVKEMSSNLMTFEVETFYNLDTVKSFGVAPHYSKKMRWWQEKFKSISLTYNLFTIKTNIVLSLLGMGVQRHGHQPAGAAIQPVDRAEHAAPFGRSEVGQAVLRVPCAGVHRHVCGLVDDEQPFILVAHVHLALDRRDIFGGRFVLNGDGNRIPRVDALHDIDLPPVQRHAAGDVLGFFQPCRRKRKTAPRHIFDHAAIHVFRHKNCQSLFHLIFLLKAARAGEPLCFHQEPLPLPVRRESPVPATCARPACGRAAVRSSARSGL